MKIAGACKAMLLALLFAMGAFGVAAPRVMAAGAPASCPSGPADTQDGCASQPAGAAIHIPDFFAYAAQSGQTFKSQHPHAWNAACIDYACGPYTPRKNAVDPAAKGNHPAGCEVKTPTGSAADFILLDCRAPAAFTWQHENFGAAFGHGPVYVTFHNSTANAQVFDDFWFTEDDSCHMPQQTFILAQKGATADFTFRNFAYDGNDPTCRQTNFGAFSILTSGNITVERFHIKNVEGRALTLMGGPASTDLIRWGLIDGWGFGPWQAHGEIGTFNPLDGPFANITISHVTALLPSTACDCSTTSWYLSNGVSGEFGSITMDHNIVVTNMVGGAGARNGVLTYHVDNGAGTGPGNVMTVDSLDRATLAVGSQIGTAGRDGQPIAVNIMEHVGGGFGVGSQWKLACMAPWGAYCTKGPLPVPSVEYKTQAGKVGNQTASAACAEMGHDTYGQVTLVNNFCDATGAIAHWYSLGTVCKSATIFKDNHDLVRGGSINGFDSTSGGC